MKYRVFYCADRLGDVSAEDAIDMELADIYTDVFPALKEDQEFFGVLDSEGTALQAMYNAESDTYWFEVPRPDLGGSFGAELSFEEAVDLMKSVDGNLPVEGFDGFEFHSWG